MAPVSKILHIFRRGYFRFTQVASALISSADRDISISLSLAVEPTFPWLLVPFTCHHNKNPTFYVRFLLWRQRRDSNPLPTV